MTTLERKLFLYRQAFQLLREENKKLKHELTMIQVIGCSSEICTKRTEDEGNSLFPL